MGFRTVLFFLGLWLALLIARRLRRQTRLRQGGRPPLPETVIPCAKCGVYVPLSRALKQDRRHFCCIEHMTEDQLT